MAKRQKSRVRRIVGKLVRLVAWCILASVLWVLLYKWVNPPITVLQVREYFKLEEGQKFRKDWADYEDISKQMPLALVAAEDQRFAHHSGFDWEAIEAAAEYNRTHDKTRGASTISQQVAKNVFLWPQRSWFRKGLEVWFAMWVELLWSKERILEVYMNVAETGTGTFGVEAASQRFFKKPSSKLSRREASLIAASIPSPRKSNPAKPSTYLNNRAIKIERQMRMLGRWDWSEQ
jgi:monofunctional glycosyltransferase